MADVISLTGDAAEIYEREFVPAIFAEWAPRILDAVALMPGQRFLDAGCGTGIVAREALRRGAHAAEITGIDLNDSMLKVARLRAPEIDWQVGDINDLPFADGSFQAVVSQFVFMFLPEPVRALKELWRVTAPGGSLALSVWSDSPVYEGLAEYARGAGLDAVADSFDAFFTLRRKEDVLALAEAAGISAPTLRRVNGSVRFASVDDCIRVELSGWVLADSLEDGVAEQLLERAREELAPFCAADGAVVFPMNAQILSARR